MGMLLLCSLLAWVTVVVGFRSPKRHDRGAEGASKVAGSSWMSRSDRLYEGEQLLSDNGQFKMEMQSDGNLVVYSAANEVMWETGTHSQGPKSHSARLQSNGDFVVRTGSPSAVLFRTGTSGDSLQLEGDGRVVIRDSNGVELWSSSSSPSSAEPRRRNRRRSRRRDDSRRRNRRRDDGPRRRDRRRSDDQPVPDRRRSGGGDGECHEFLFIGDQGYRSSKQAEAAEGLAKVASKNNPSAIFALGDNIYNGKGGMEWMETSWYDYYPKKHSSLRRPWYGMVGNHDWENDAREQVEFTNHSKNQGGHWNMPDLYYKKSFTTGSGTTIDFLVIDSYLYMGNSAPKKALGSDAPGKHKDWLDAELGRSSADWKVVLAHHPPYIWTRRRKKVTKGSFSGLHDVLEKHKVPMFGAGHFHNLGISKGDRGIRTFLSGAGGKNRPSRGGSDCLSNPGDSDSNNLAYCDCLGFVGVKFCGKSEAEISLYDGKGERRHREKSPNTNRMSKSDLELDLPSEENISMSLPPSLPFVPFSVGDGDRQILCKGIELVEVDRVCARDHCTVSTDRNHDTCEEYCAISGLACLGGWMQADEAEECEPSVSIGCQQGKIKSVHNKICQCGWEGKAPLRPF